MEVLIVLIIFVAIIIWVRRMGFVKKKSVSKPPLPDGKELRPHKIKTTSRTGAKRTKEEKQRDRDVHSQRIGDEIRKLAKETRLKAERVDSPGYIWRTVGVGTCEHCAPNEGKKFKWNNPPKTGHPGEGRLCKNGHCKCWAEVIVPPPPKR